MTAADIEIILQAAKGKYPEARPRIISDNGPQFIPTAHPEVGRASRGGATMIPPGEREAALRERNHAEG